jgi:hypothetical protein
VFIGGYKDPDPAGNNAWFLSPDFPDLERVPNRSASLEREHGEYLVFWPACGRGLARSNHSGPTTNNGSNGVALVSGAVCFVISCAIFIF